VKHIDDRLSELLHKTTPDPPVAVAFDSVARRARQRRRLGTIGAAAGAAVLVVGVTALPVISGAGGGTPAPNPGASPTRAGPSLPGLDPPFEARILTECARPWKGPTGAGPADVSKPVDKVPPAFDLYNYVKAPGGYHALLFDKGNNSALLCVYDSRLPEGGIAHRGPVRGERLDWLPGDVSSDEKMSQPGGVDWHDGKVTRPPHQLLQIVAGRVSDRVAKVVFYGADGSTVTVKPVAGTYIASIYLRTASREALRATGSGARVVGTVRAYDASGRLLAESDPNHDREPDECYLLPDGTELARGRKPESVLLPSCQPAVPWTH
jgi:hypothetical protein